MINHYEVARDRRYAFGYWLPLFFLEPRKICFLSFVRTLHCRRIFLLIVCNAGHTTVGRGEHIRAVGVIIVEACSVPFVAESTFTDLRNVERELFRNGPAMTCVKRSSVAHIPNTTQRKDVIILCKFRFDWD